MIILFMANLHFDTADYPVLSTIRVFIYHDFYIIILYNFLQAYILNFWIAKIVIV